MPRVTCQTSPHRPNDLEIIEENLASDFSDLAIGTGVPSEFAPSTHAVHVSECIHAPPIPVLSIRDTASHISYSTTSTRSNLPGPGRALGHLYSRGGRVLEHWANTIAHQCGYGPYATSLKIADGLESACLYVDERLDRDMETNGAYAVNSTMDTYLARLEEKWGKLVEYANSGTSQTRVIALHHIIKSYLNLHTIVHTYLYQYEPLHVLLTSSDTTFGKIQDDDLEQMSYQMSDLDEGRDIEEFSTLLEVLQILSGPKMVLLMSQLGDIHEDCEPDILENGNMRDVTFCREDLRRLLKPLFKTIMHLSCNSSVRARLWSYCTNWMIEQQLISTHGGSECASPQSLIDGAYSDLCVRANAKSKRRHRDVCLV